MPGIRREWRVTQDAVACHWCHYPIEYPSRQAVLVIGGIVIVPPICSQHCSDTEARVRGRGPLVEAAL